MRSPRYQACLYVDKEALESATLTEHPLLSSPTGLYLNVKRRVVLVDSQFQDEWAPPHPETTQEELEEMEEKDWEEEQYTPIDGDTDFDIGWMYIKLRFTTLRGFLRLSGLQPKYPQMVVPAMARGAIPVGATTWTLLPMFWRRCLMAWRTLDLPQLAEPV
jgi:hypothetical protein